MDIHLSALKRRHQRVVHRGVPEKAAPEIIPGAFGSDSDPEEDGGELSAAELELPIPDELQMLGAFMQHQLLETPAQPSAGRSSSSSAAGPAKSGKGTKEASGWCRALAGRESDKVMSGFFQHRCALA